MTHVRRDVWQTAHEAYFDGQFEFERASKDAQESADKSDKDAPAGPSGTGGAPQSTIVDGPWLSAFDGPWGKAEDEPFDSMDSNDDSDDVIQKRAILKDPDLRGSRKDKKLNQV